MKIVKPFHFKQFKVHQSKDVFKVGTDGVLLGAWTDVTGRHSIADLGCGTGLISLMLAQRNLGARLMAYDISEAAIALAQTNFKNSPWPNRLAAEKTDLKQLNSSKKFDLIVSNPPYFRNSIKPLKQSDQRSKHDTEFNLHGLSHVIDSITDTDARVSIILPPDETGIFQETLEEYNFEILRRCEVQSLSSKPVERIMTEFIKGKISVQNLISEKLIIQSSKKRHDYTDDFKKLMKDYYLIL